MPNEVGVPLIVIVLVAQIAKIPGGKLVGIPIPVAPVVECVIAVIGELTHKTGLDDATVTVLLALIVMVKTVTLLTQPIAFFTVRFPV